jgi:hypothetical protein
MYYELLNNGDHVFSITNDILAIERNDGSVELYPLSLKDNKLQLNTDAVITIGYSQDDCSDKYITENGVHVVNF